MQIWRTFPMRHEPTGDRHGGLAISEVPVGDPAERAGLATEGGGWWRRSICASWWQGLRALRPV